MIMVINMQLVLIYPLIFENNYHGYLIINMCEYL